MTTLEQRLAQLRSGRGVTSGQQGGNAAGEGDAGKADETELVRLKQELADAQKVAQDALPYMDAIEALSVTTVGKDIVERLRKGEDLTKFQLSKIQEKVQQQAGEGDGAGGGTPLTMEALEQKLVEYGEKTAKRVGETIRANEGARIANDRLEEWAVKKFGEEAYKKVRGSDTWAEVFNLVMAGVQNKAIRVPAGTDPWEYITQRTYNLIVSEDPDILKGEVPAASDEASRVAEILASGSRASASEKAKGKEDLSKIRGGYYERALNFAEGRPSGAIAGKSYANRGGGKKE